MSTRFWLAVAIFLPTLVHAQAASLTEISEFADSICDQIRPEGSISRTEIEGSLRGQASGVAKLLGLTVGADGRVKHGREDYRGLPLDHVAEQMQGSRECKRQLAALLISERSRLAQSQVRYKTCRHPDFGQEGWNRSETFTQSSGWVGGGSNPQNWCNQLVSNIISSRSIGSQYVSEVLDSGESARWTGWHGRDREYNYTCKVKISWDPRYRERTDARCGTF
ncbi:hypothetical protein TMEC50S_02021 [Thauera mechernichensis]